MISVKVFGIDVYGDKVRIANKIKAVLADNFNVRSNQVQVLFVESESQASGSPVLAEISLCSTLKNIPVDTETLVAALHATANYTINIGVNYYDQFYSGENPERSLKFHRGENAFPPREVADA
jgi:phenylpyruvate tautomerase PptA (4-oxalocrotonate tautomerase family)